MSRKAQQRIDAEALTQDDKSDPDDGVSKSPLVRIFSGKNNRELREGPKDKPFSSSWNEFYGLWYYSWQLRGDYRALLDRRKRKSPPKQLREQLCELSGSLATTALLVPFLHYAFVSLVEELLDHVRPGYSRVTQPTDYIRGRLNPVSAAMVAEGAGTRCVCTFDTFGLDTPLMQVIQAALGVVVDYQGELSQLPTTQETAVWLKGFLQGVRPVSVPRAFRQGVALHGRLSNADSAWEHALRLACLVIEGQKGVSPAAGDLPGVFGWASRGSKGFVFDVDTSSIWQNIISHVWPEHTQQIHETVVPWTPKIYRGMKADDVHVAQLNTGAYCRQYSERWDIIDSKYKKRPVTPTASDQRQMFTYACAYPYVTVKSLVSRPVPYKAMAWLVYPEFQASTKKDLRSRRSEPWDRMTMSGTDAAQLSCIETKFPEPTDCLSQRSWNRYLVEVANDIAELIKTV